LLEQDFVFTLPNVKPIIVCFLHFCYTNSKHLGSSGRPLEISRWAKGWTLGQHRSNHQMECTTYGQKKYT